MTETELKLEFSINESSGGMPVIVAAAGNSARMKGINKQMACISGVPVIIRTLLAFEHSDVISNIILVTRAEDIFELQILAGKYGITKLTDIVCGGSNRQESVAKGFSRLGKSQKKVLIHDGARPLVDGATISRVAKALKIHNAVTCAVPVKDTLKVADSDGKVLKTLKRDSIFAVQTPQGVDTEMYLDALQRFNDLSVFTDDMSVMEAAGYDVYITEGSYKNIKITTPEDILIAQTYIREESE